MYSYAFSKLSQCKKFQINETFAVLIQTYQFYDLIMMYLSIYVYSFAQQGITRAEYTF